MPCYQVRTVEVSFKVGNIELLKKALEKAGWKITSSGEWGINISNANYKTASIRFTNSKIQSSFFNEKELTGISNQIKRAYSEVVIDEIAKKQKWLKRQMGQNQFQLQRF
jgi:hypothetical protein